MILRGSVKVRGLGRQFGDHDEVILPSDQSVWHDVPRTFARRVYVNGTRTIRIEMDWSELTSEMEQLTKYTNAEFVKLSKSAQKKAYGRNAAILPYRISFNGPRPLLPALMRYYLHEVFLIINIASPGAFRAYEVGFEDDRESKPFSLSAGLFEDAWLYSIDHGWPPIGLVSIDEVARWYHALLPDVSEIATTRLPKALFSLLHASDLSDAEPTVVLWLAQCLESLFEVPNALSRNILQSRSFALLGSPDNKKAVSKTFQQFFEARNSFVHGGADVSYPGGDFLSDNVLERFMSKWLRPTEFASSIVVAALQQHAKHNWRELTWAESYVPIEIS